MTRLTKLYLGLVAFSLAGTLLSRTTGLDPGPIAPVSALLVLLIGFAAAFAPLGKRALLPVLLVLLVGALAEVVGLYTGFPFGAYEYTERWWPTVALPGAGPYPVLLPLAWAMMAGCSYLLAERWLKSWAAIPAGAGLAASIDLFMEPVMTGPLGYWRWTEPGPLPGGAPVLNFVGWLLTSLIAGLILRAFRVTDESRSSAPVLAGYLVLTFGIFLIYSLPG